MLNSAITNKIKHIEIMNNFNFNIFVSYNVH